MIFKGIPAASGIAIGNVFLIEDEEFFAVKRNIAKDEVKKEVERFKEAIVDIKIELEKTKNDAAKHLGKKHLRIFDVYLFIVDDPVLKDEVISKITKELVNVEYALYEVMEANARIFEKIEDEYFKERGKDIYNAGKKILKYLAGISKKSLENVMENSIVFANNLTPTDTITMKNENVMGFAINYGGKTSHTAIMARAMEIPAVVGMKDITSKVVHGDIVIVDGNEGIVIVKPDVETLENYRRHLENYRIEVKDLSQLVNISTATRDGKKIIIAANMEVPEEVHSIILSGADGIGLFRTEYLFIGRTEFPTEEEQFESYSQIVERIFPNPVIMRTIDLGGDKLLPYFNVGAERNPFMGLRAIRFCLKYPEIFKKQLRAILRSSNFGNVKLMYPMISGVEELFAANVILNEVKQELRNKSIPFDEDIEVGVMVEIPSAAITVDLFAKEVDFLSIGTNDLIQYTLVVDRVNEYVADLYNPFHLSVLRLLKNIIDVGYREGKWVSMCGEMAADPSCIEVLLGLGLEHFSVAATSVLKIKKEILKTNLSKAKKFTEEIFNEFGNTMSAKILKQKKRI
ncbi:MAG: phosphoenolpyruvate--protein phosphotransferase [Elusimicrobiota bacterium]